MIPAGEIAPKLFQNQPTRMYLTRYIISFVFLNFSQLCSSLQHEKSFMAPEGSAPVWRFDFYGDSLLQTSSNDIVQRSIENGLIRRVFRAHTNQIWSFTVMKDSKLVTAGWDDMVVVWDLQTGAILHRIWLGASETLVNAVSFHNDLVFTGGKDTKLRQINSLTGRIMRTTGKYNLLIAISSLDTFQQISSIVSDGIFLYLATTSPPFPIIKYRIISISVQQDFMGHPSPVFALHISNSLLFSASGDASMFCWNTFNGLLLRSFVGHRLAIFALTTVGDELYSGGQDVFIIKWKVTTGEIAQVLPMYHSNAVRWLAQKEGSLFSGSDDTNIIQWNVTQDSPAFFYLGQKITLRAVALWKNYVLSGGDNTNIDVWDTSFESIQPFVTLRGHFNSVNCLKVHEDFLFSGSSDENIVQWNLTAFTMFRTLSGKFSN
jgi:WD40 repeat protein